MRSPAKGQINSGRIATKLGLSGITPLAEEVIIARDIMLAESAGARLHIAHISTVGRIGTRTKRQDQRSSHHL